LAGSGSKRYLIAWFCGTTLQTIRYPWHKSPRLVTAYSSVDDHVGSGAYFDQTHPTKRSEMSAVDRCVEQASYIGPEVTGLALGHILKAHVDQCCHSTARLVRTTNTCQATLTGCVAQERYRDQGTHCSESDCSAKCKDLET